LADFPTSPFKDLQILLSSFYYVCLYYVKTYDSAKMGIDGDNIAVDGSQMG